MKKTRHSITVRGRQSTWCFDVYATSADVATWRADGLEVDELVNTIPDWIAGMGLARPWCWLQDLWNLKWTQG